MAFLPSLGDLFSLRRRRHGASEPFLHPDKPSYAAIFKLDLDEAGEPPKPMTPPCHIRSVKPRRRCRVPPAEDSQFMDRRTANDYDLAARPPENAFRDLRSAARARQRHTAQLDVYYGWKGVNRGQLGATHYAPNTTFYAGPGAHDQYTLDDSRVPIITMTKKLLYQEAQSYPKPPRWHYSQRFERDQSSKRRARRERVQLAAESNLAFGPQATSRRKLPKDPIDALDIMSAYLMACEWCAAAQAEEIAVSELSAGNMSAMTPNDSCTGIDWDATSYCSLGCNEMVDEKSEDWELVGD